jgi:hypothetical protein
MAARIVPARRTTQPSPFGAPPIFPGEDGAAYDDLVARFRAAIKPKDVLEDLFLRDVVDLTWETLRIRRLKAGLLKCVMLDKLSEILEPLGADDSSDDELSADELEDESSDDEISAYELAQRWAARDPEAIEAVDKQLASKGLTVENVAAQALFAEVESFERIDRMVMNAEARRNAALRELERRRMTLVQALRQASDDVVEADFEDVAPNRRRLRDKA